MKKVIRIDKDGLYIEDVILFDDNVPNDCIDVDCPNGFILPKWNGEEWVEGGVKAEISNEIQINMLKEELNATDYKVIKCYEYQLTNKELPYDIEQIHIERQLIRDKIAELEV